MSLGQALLGPGGSKLMTSRSWPFEVHVAVDAGACPKPALPRLLAPRDSAVKHRILKVGCWGEARLRWDSVCAGVGERCWGQGNGRSDRSRTPLPFKEQPCAYSSNPTKTPRHGVSFGAEPATTKCWNSARRFLQPQGALGFWAQPKEIGTNKTLSTIGHITGREGLRERERERDWIFYLSGHAGSRESIISKKVECDFICLSMYLKWVIWIILAIIIITSFSFSSFHLWDHGLELVPPQTFLNQHRITLCLTLLCHDMISSSKETYALMRSSCSSLVLKFSGPQNAFYLFILYDPVAGELIHTN